MRITLPFRCPPRAAILRSGAALLMASAGFFATAPQAFAERADKEKPAVINADKSSGDDLNQTQLYTGDVVLTKGTIILRADQLTTKQDPEGYNFGVAIVTKPNTLAYFKQKREGVDEYIEGQAERIEYDEKSDTIRLFNRAVVKRLAAGRDADEIRGDRIDYNTRTEVYVAQSDAKKRVTVVLQPKIKPGSLTDPAAAATRPTPSPAIELRKEPAIEAKPAS
ncbi:MAG: lipopolysaccharide transport periplasmic protein LptA [Burkholderiaceae bacterium]